MGIDHIDLVVTDFERSLSFYRGLLGPLGYTREGPIVGERGEHVLYFGHEAGIGQGAISLRSAQSAARGVPYDRYAIGVHHIAIAAPSREVVDECTQWLLAEGATIESGPAEYDYSPGYYAVFFYDPDGIKLEIVHR
jgi:catechol 2,3-dioxygenase-like lactoylglutathione lyase family enzyme